MESDRPRSHDGRMGVVARTRSRFFSSLACLPTVQSIAFDGAYVGSTPGCRVGGDWYDAFERPDGTFAVSIGDVEGCGADAALEMATIRAALSAFERVCAYPVTSLQHLDAFVERAYPELFVTAFQARFDPASRRLSYANAGHPAPFVRSADGSLRRLFLADVPLGIGRWLRRTLYIDELRAGDTLVAFTDGVIETTHDIAAGERRLAEAILDPAFAAAAHPAAWLRTTLVARYPHDDVAILTMRVLR